MLSKVRLTSAMPLGLLVLEPLNTKAPWFSLLKADILCSPITQRMLSMILLFPQPLGPMMPVIPSSKSRVVLSAKLLNPLMSKLFNRMYLTELATEVVIMLLTIQILLDRKAIYEFMIVRSSFIN